MSEDNLNNLRNQYLLATPAVKDPLFASSLVYMCEHNAEGSMGLVVNHRSEQNLEAIFEQLEIDCHDETIRQTPVFLGGPVQLQQGFVLHDAPPRDYEQSLQVGDDMYLTTSLDILQDIAQGKGPAHYLVALGYAGWAAGQLEQELQDNAWLTAPAHPEITFHPDIDARWQLAFDQLGFDLDSLSPTTGSA